MTILPVIIFSFCIILCIAIVMLVSKFISYGKKETSPKLIQRPPSIPLRKNISIQFYLSTIFFLFWMNWLLFFLLPWMFVYQKNGLSRLTTISLIFISSFFIVGYILASLKTYKQKDET